MEKNRLYTGILALTISVLTLVSSSGYGQHTPEQNRTLDKKVNYLKGRRMSATTIPENEGNSAIDVNSPAEHKIANPEKSQYEQASPKEKTMRIAVDPNAVIVKEEDQKKHDVSIKSDADQVNRNLQRQGRGGSMIQPQDQSLDTKKNSKVRKDSSPDDSGDKPEIIHPQKH